MNFRDDCLRRCDFFEWFSDSFENFDHFEVDGDDISSENRREG